MTEHDIARSRGREIDKSASVSSGAEELLLAALERGASSFETGRFLISFRKGMLNEGIMLLKAKNFRVADARDFSGQAVNLEKARGAEAMVLPELGVALVGGDALDSHGMSITDELSAEGPIEIIEPEFFVFSDSVEYLRGFASAANTIAHDLGGDRGVGESDEERDVNAKGATWGLTECKVLQSNLNGDGIKVAVLDTGMDFGHPDFAKRTLTIHSFVAEDEQDLNGHGTHCTGTACGPKTPPEENRRYGIAFGSQIFVGKVLTNTGTGTDGATLNGINWALGNGCEVISLSLGRKSQVLTAYTKAGTEALDRGCLIIAAAGNDSCPTGAPANSPTIMSVASVDSNLKPSGFSNFGKIEIAAPGRDVFSSWLRPKRYQTKSGTSQATPHVAGCAALWAQTSSHLRGKGLWDRLASSARKLLFPPKHVGAGLVQAP